VLAGDAASARRVLAELSAMGMRGRAMSADLEQIKAGIAALDGDEAGSVSSYRTALAAYRSLGLAWDEAILGLAAGTWLDTSNAEVRAWLESAREIAARLGAKSFVAALDRRLAAARPGAGRATAAGRLTPADQTAESVSST
jgi:hypothetical protein